jgi:hypothetical protein
MLLGVLLLLARFNVVTGSVWQFWPLVLVAMGVSRFLDPAPSARRVGSFTLLLVIWLLANSTELLRWRDSWPLVLVVMGLDAIWKALAPASAVPLIRPPRPPRPSRGSPNAEPGDGSASDREVTP